MLVASISDSSLGEGGLYFASKFEDKRRMNLLASNSKKLRNCFMVLACIWENNSMKVSLVPKTSMTCSSS